MFGNLGKLSFTILPAVAVRWVASGGGGQWRVTPAVPRLGPAFWLAHACPILASDWPSEWPGDHPWPRSSPVSGHSPCSEAHEAPPDTALHIARTCSTKYCPWSTGSLARIINHIIQRNETCAFGVSTGACQSMSLVQFYTQFAWWSNYQQAWYKRSLMSVSKTQESLISTSTPNEHCIVWKGNLPKFVTPRCQLSNWVMVKFLNQDTNCNNKYGPFWDMWHGDW